MGTLKASGSRTFVGVEREVMFGENANCQVQFQEMDGSQIP